MNQKQPAPALGEAEDRRGIRRPRRVLVAAVIFLGAATVVAAVQRSADGPLDFPDGFEVMHHWSAGGVFTVLEACGADGPVEVEVVDVEPVTLTGADKIGFKVGWASPDRPSRWGAGSLPVPAFYADDVRAGTAIACGNGPSSLEIAVTMPEATTRDVIANGFEVTYLVGHTTYVEVADARFGACATDPRPAPSPRCKGRKGAPPA